MTTIELLVLREAMPSSVAISLDVLATANRLRAMASRPPAFAVRFSGSAAAAARRLAVHAPEAAGPAAVTIVPGLGLATEDEVRARLDRRDVAAAGRALKAAVAAGGEIATSCSGAFLFARAGLLDGRRATTSWWLAPVFRRLFPQVDLDTDELIVRDGPVTTGGAAMAQVDLMLSLVARHADPDLADDCARYLLLDARRSQARYMALGFLTSADPAVDRAGRWARERLDQTFGVEDLASAAGLTPRTFARRLDRVAGLSPVRFLQRLRAERAMELLETTKLPLDEVARRVGYAEPSTLRRILQRDAGRTPRDLRP